MSGLIFPISAGGSSERNNFATLILKLKQIRFIHLIKKDISIVKS